MYGNAHSADVSAIRGTRAVGGATDTILQCELVGDLVLVTINGVARYGTSKLMSTLAPPDQTVRVRG